MRYVAPLAALLFLVAAGSAQPPDPAALLALHAQYVGWEFGDGTFTSMRIAGAIVNTKPDSGSTPKPPGPIARLVRGALYRDTYTDTQTGRREDDGFTGHIFWESNDNGFTHPIIGLAQEYAIDFELLLNEGTASLSATAEDPVTIDGVTYPVVRVAPADAYPMDLAVDPNSGAYVQAVIDPGGSDDTTIDILKYADVLPGKRMIANYRVHDSHYTTEYTSFEPNLPIADEELHPPAQTATWTFADPNPFPIQAHTPFILVQASVNGTSGTFILDTGADGILMTSRFATLAHVRRMESTRTGGIGGWTSAETDIIDTLTIGGNTLSNVTATSSRLGNYPHGLFDGFRGETIDGLLGYDLLGGAIVKVNIGAQTMSILDPNTTSLSQESGILLNLDLRGGQPLVPMTLNGTIAVNALLDSGDAMGIGYSPHFAEKHGMTLLRGRAFAAGVGGVELESCGPIGKLTIGTVLFEGEGACTTSALRGDYLLVGIDFLRHFNWVFDYPAGLMILEPLPG